MERSQSRAMQSGAGMQPQAQIPPGFRAMTPSPLSASPYPLNLQNSAQPPPATRPTNQQNIAPLTSDPSNPQNSESSVCAAGIADYEPCSVEKLVLFLNDENTRPVAAGLLAKRQQKTPNLALMIWNSFQGPFNVLKEILPLYYKLSPPRVDMGEAHRACNALTLMQVLASHPTTIGPFLRAQMVSYCLPFMDSHADDKQLGFLRLSALGVVGAVAKHEHPEAIAELLSLQIFPLLLCCIEVGGYWTKIVATFVIYKVLSHDMGKQYCCGLADRFFSIGNVLKKAADTSYYAWVIQKGTPEDQQLHTRFLNQILRCYLRISEYPSPWVHGALPKILPRYLFDDSTLQFLVYGDPAAEKVLKRLKVNLGTILNLDLDLDQTRNKAKYHGTQLQGGNQQERAELHSEVAQGQEASNTEDRENVEALTFDQLDATKLTHLYVE